MATKKTNKTSHVMNLLTNGAPPEAEHQEEASSPAAAPETQASGSQEASAAGTQEKKGDVQSHTVSPKKVTVVDESSRNDRLSQEILNKLSEELEEEQGMENQKLDNTQEQETPAALAQEPPAEPEERTNEENQSEKTPQVQPELPEPAPASEPEPASTPVSEPAPDPAPAPVSESAPTPEPVPVPAPAPEPSPSKEADPEPALTEEEPIQMSGKTAHHAFLSKGNESLINGEFRFINVMEHLMLRQDISSCMDQYNVCKCPRCMADVCALALTGLPPKYVVTSKDSLSPLISYYENRNKITILTALIKACNKVRENPHHQRP